MKIKMYTYWYSYWVILT